MLEIAIPKNERLSNPCIDILQKSVMGKKRFEDWGFSCGPISKTIQKLKKAGKWNLIIHMERLVN